MLAAAPLTLMLLVLNGAIGAYTLFVNPSLIERWAFRPYAVVRERAWGSFITAAFVHNGLAHLAFNMITLYNLGPYVEGRLGLWRYLALYLGSDIAANLATLWRFRDTPTYSAVGASGAISGVVFSFVVFEPLARLFFFPIPVGIPAVLFGVLYVLLSIYAAKQGRGRIAHEAHIGGAVGGVLLTLLLYPAALGIFLRQLGL